MDEESQHTCGHTHVATKSRLNWLRAMVLGFLDGLVSIASLLLGIIAASNNNRLLIISGISAICGGSLSMTIGEYISVSSQKDSEQADVQKEIDEHAKGENARNRELMELTQIYINRGLNSDLAKQVAIELTEKDVIRAHARDELNIDIDEPIKPIQAAISSGLAFLFGSIPPLLSVAFWEAKNAKIITIVILSEFLFLGIALLSSYLGGTTNYLKTVLRVIILGSMSLSITFLAGYIANILVGN
jgi:VIT1/CCC1 family predicted Fe2+/Mn2+ transporter